MSQRCCWWYGPCCVSKWKGKQNIIDGDVCQSTLSHTYDGENPRFSGQVHSWQGLCQLTVPFNLQHQRSKAVERIFRPVAVTVRLEIGGAAQLIQNIGSWIWKLGKSSAREIIKSCKAGAGPWGNHIVLQCTNDLLFHFFWWWVTMIYDDDTYHE